MTGKTEIKDGSKLIDKKSFSQLVKEELCDVERVSEDEHALILAFTLASLGSFRGDGIRLKINNFDFADFLEEALANLIPGKYIVNEQKSQVTFKVNDDVETTDLVKAFLYEELGFNTVRGQVNTTPDEFAEEERKTILRAGFLANGSMAMPEQNYQIEFVIKRKSVNSFYLKVLELENLDVLAVASNNKILYLKSGDDISTFLAKIGAHKSLLNFENIRVHKTVNEQVNRAVNFDNANIERVTNTAVKQIGAIRQLIEANGFNILPEDLKEIANARLENPGYSLREIGESLEKPLGKSGVYHRFSKLEKWIADYLANEERK